MKKILTISVFLIGAPAFALCPISFDGENVCSLQTSGSSTSPIFKSPSAGAGMNTSQGQAQQPALNNALNNPLRSTVNSNPQYNTGCQFGSCVQGNSSASANNQKQQ